MKSNRNSLSLGLRESAKLAGISASYLSDIENNNRLPSFEILYKLCNAYKISFLNTSRILINVKVQRCHANLEEEILCYRDNTPTKCRD